MEITLKGFIYNNEMFVMLKAFWLHQSKQMNQLVFSDLCYVLYLLISIVSEVPTLAFPDFSHINQNIYVFFSSFFP